MQALFSRRRNFGRKLKSLENLYDYSAAGEDRFREGKRPRAGKVGHQSGVIGVTEKARLLHFNAPQDDRGVI
jgi:hypothetical protein